VLDDRRYTEIIVTRVTVPVGEDIGFLPGTEEEKMSPWMGALDGQPRGAGPQPTTGAGEWGRAATDDLVRSTDQDQEPELHARAHLPEQVRASSTRRRTSRPSR
jgi:hypothetical protein